MKQEGRQKDGVGKELAQNRIEDLSGLLMSGEKKVKDISRNESDQCIWYLYYSQQHNKTEIANGLKITRRTVYNSVKRTMERYSEDIRLKGLNPTEEYVKIIGGLTFVKSKAKQGADWKLYLDILMKEVELMHRFGLIEDKPQKISISLETTMQEQLKDKDIIDIDNYIDEIRELRKSIRAGGDTGQGTSLQQIPKTTKQ